MKFILGLLAALLLPVSASAREVIEVTTRLSATSATGQFLIYILFETLKVFH
jgi:hypothetical protein